MMNLDKLLFRINPVMIIKRSSFFDEKWYRETYNVSSNAASHYLNEGWKKDYNPSLKFSSKDYLINNPDIKDVNPLLHYEVFGKYEGRRPFVPRISGQNNYDLNDVDLPLEKYFERIKEKKIISFDVFDTLVIRPFVKAEEVFDYLEKEYQTEGFADRRKEAEKKARVLLNKEVNIDEIYDFIPEEYKHLKEKEIEFEIRGCHLNPLIRLIYDKAKEENKRVIATSDMYLGKDIVEKILSGNSYVMDEIYVSCDYNKTKGSGELFDLVSEKENANKEKFIHFGDNYISDYSEAINRGIEAYQTPKIVDHVLNRKENSFLLSFMKENASLSSSVYLAQAAEYLSQNEETEYFEKLAYLFGGPLALGYLNFVCEKAKSENIDKLLFVSRDGYLLKELYEKYLNDKYQIDAEYAYLSRSCIYAGNEENHLCKNLKQFLNIMKLSILEIDTDNDPQAEYDKYKEQIKEYSLSQSNNLKNHLETIAGESNNIATVDMFSGNYTSQKGAEYYLTDRIKCGFYAGNFADNELKHYSFSDRLLGMRDNLPVKVSEFLITSNENSLVGIDDEGKPLYEESDDSLRKERYEKILKGCEAYINDYLRFFRIDSEYLLNLEEWIKLTDHYLRECDEKDLEKLSKIIDSENPTRQKDDKSIKTLIDQYREKGY